MSDFLLKHSNWFSGLVAVFCLYIAVVDYGQGKYYWALFNVFLAVCNVFLMFWNRALRRRRYNMQPLHVAVLQTKYPYPVDHIKFFGNEIKEQDKPINLFFCLTSTRYCPDCGTAFSNELIKKRPKDLICSNVPQCGSYFHLNYKNHTAERNYNERS